MHNNDVAVGPVALADVSVHRGLVVWPLSSRHRHHECIVLRCEHPVIYIALCFLASYTMYVETGGFVYVVQRFH